MALAFAQYYVFAYVLFVVLCAVTTALFFVSALTFGQNAPIRQILEAIIGIIVIKGLTVLADRVIFKGGDLAHPVAWTWYSTYLLILNLIRGILSGIVRMVIMCVWIVFQIGVMHRSNFPEGKVSPNMPSQMTDYAFRGGSRDSATHK